MEKLRVPVSFFLPELVLSRTGVPTDITTVPIYGKEMANACLAQIDLLGFSALLRRAGGSAAEVVQDIYQNTELHARLGTRTDGDDKEQTIALFQYADTINVVARDDGDMGIKPVIMATAAILASLHGRGLPARAGVSMGEVWAMSHREEGGSDGDFVSGPAVAAAHEVEAAQDWAGGVLDPSCARLLESEETKRLVSAGWVVPAKVPTKARTGSELRILLAVNWARVLHVPNLEWFASLLGCDNAPQSREKREWRKRRAAYDFYDLHGAGALPEHRDDYIAWLISPSGLHLPLMPGVALML